MKRISIFMIFAIGLLASLSVAGQTQKTAKGFFCGFSEGDGGYLSMRVAGTVKTFAWYGDEPELKFVGFRKGNDTDLHSLPVGTELIVNYVFKRPKMGGRATNIMRKLTSTGNMNRQTRSCDDD